MLSWIWLVPTLPFLGFLVLAIFGRRFALGLNATIGAGSVGLSFVAAAGVAVALITSPPPGGSFSLVLWQWLNVAGFTPSISFTVDALSVVMTLVVTGVGFLIHLYSTRFMLEEEGYSRFFACMNLFVGSMLVLVLASNLLLLYLGWEGVGLCSYLLIGFWYSDPENGKAARKAFIVTRIGDVSLAVGIFIVATTLGTLDFAQVSAKALAGWPVGSTLAVATAALILGGAVGKSAQLPLQTWLPDAMAGPTPVSALIHAATMVTAGVYLIARTNALFSLAPAVQTAVAVIGAAGLLISAVSATTQTDIKRVLAYSTVSQIGYMFLALGVGAWSGAIFHLVTQALFKSLLFMAAGVVILAMSHEHNIFRMGGLARKTPWAFWMFLVGALALTAIPPITAGFASKDHILVQAWQTGPAGKVFSAIGLAGAFFTSIYAFRLLFVVFTGQPSAAAGHGAHGSGSEAHGHAAGADGMQSGGIMGSSLGVLAFLCLVGGLLSFPGFLGGKPILLSFLGTALPAEAGGEPAAGTELTLTLVSLVVSLLGVPLAWLLARRERALEAARPGQRPALVGFLKGGWGFDWLYDRALIRPFEWVARINVRDVVNRVFDDGVGGLSMLLSRAFRLTQNGRVRWYAAGLVGGAVLVVAAVVLL